MSVKRLQLEQQDLSSRRTAAELREELIGHILAGKKIHLNLKKVCSVSESFADELFGVLVAIYGLEWLHKNIQVEVSQESVLKSIAVALKRRLDLTPPPNNKGGHSFLTGC